MAGLSDVNAGMKLDPQTLAKVLAMRKGQGTTSGGGKVWFSLNGTWTQGDPATDTSPEGTLAAGSTYRPGIAVESGAHLTATLRTTLAEFSTAPPSGFTSWATT